MKNRLLILLLLGFTLLNAQNVKIDTVFVGKANAKEIKNYLKNRATVFIVIRHGEKEDNSKNPHLSEEGKKRAKNLAALLKSVKIDEIYS